MSLRMVEKSYFEVKVDFVMIKCYQGVDYGECNCYQ